MILVYHIRQLNWMKNYMADFFKEKVIQARLFWGLSLQEVGDKLEVSKQYIQQIENGKKIPNKLFIDALAEVLNVSSNFFEKPIINMTMESQCHFRKAKTTPVSIKERALQQSSLFEDLIDFIDDELSLPIVNFVENSPIDNESIEQSAENCRKNWGIDLDTPIKNLAFHIEKSGAVITNFSDISDKIDAFSINKKRPIIIRNPSKDTACRFRFDLAHECGHLILHNGITTGDVETESQANRFASALLLPRGAFLKEFRLSLCSYRINWQELIRLKSKWKVSLGAIIRRGYELGLIDATKYRSACIYLNNRGYTKKEPLDDSIPLEQPIVLNKSLKMLETNGKLDYYLKTRGIKDSFLEKLSGYKPNNIANNVICIDSYR